MTDQEDFARFLDEYGFTAEQARASTEQTADMIPMPEWVDSVSLRKSPIEGLGMFAVRPIPSGALIAPARISGCRTPAGRFVNHSPKPNARYEPLGPDLYLVAIRQISEGQEVTADYRQSMQVNGWGRVPRRLTPHDNSLQPGISGS